MSAWNWFNSVCIEPADHMYRSLFLPSSATDASYPGFLPSPWLPLDINPTSLWYRLQRARVRSTGGGGCCSLPDYRLISLSASLTYSLQNNLIICCVKGYFSMARETAIKKTACLNPSGLLRSTDWLHLQCITAIYAGAEMTQVSAPMWPHAWGRDIWIQTDICMLKFQGEITM